MRFLFKLIITLALTIPVLANEPTAFLCIGESGSTFSLNNHQWAPAPTVNAHEYKFILKLNDSHEWKYAKHGQAKGYFDVSKCRVEFDSQGYMTCSNAPLSHGAPETFHFNNQSYRFSYYNNIGYVLPSKAVGASYEGDYAPHIIIGKCSPL